MVVETLVLEVPSLNSRLHTAVAAKTLTVPAGPVNGVLVSIVDPVLVVFEYQHHASGAMGREVVNL